MTTIGIKELKAKLGRFISRASAGEKVLVTDRGVPVALLSAVPPDLEALTKMSREGHIQWSGRKPKGLPQNARRKKRGKDPGVSRAVVEDRDR